MLEHRKYTRPDVCRVKYEAVHHGERNNVYVGSAPSLAIVYSPYQKFDNLFTPCEALHKGTLFSELHKPFFGTCDGNGSRRGEC